MLDKEKHVEIRAGFKVLKGLMKVAQLSATIPDLLPDEYERAYIYSLMLHQWDGYLLKEEWLQN